jgi:UDP-glucose 4-epimerase
MDVAWVTGARGFIGRHLALALARRDMRVAGLGHGAWTEAEAASWGVSLWINGDVSQPNLMRLVHHTGVPGMVFHLAGGSSVGLSLQTPEEDFRRSVVSTVQLLEWLRHHAPRARVVLASSAAVYGAGYDRPIGEQDPTAPYSPYGYHKRAAELLCESYSKNFAAMTAVVRLFSVYGPELRKQLLWDLCTQLKANPERVLLAGSGLERRDWLHVTDAAEYLIQAGAHTSPEGFVVNGGTGCGVTVLEIAESVRSLWNSRAPICFSGKSRAGDPFCLVADPLVGQSLGLHPSMAWLPGVEDYVTWYRRNESR